MTCIVRSLLLCVAIAGVGVGCTRGANQENIHGVLTQATLTLPSAYWRQNNLDAQGNINPKYYAIAVDGKNVTATDVCTGNTVFTASVKDAKSFKIERSEAPLQGLPENNGEFSLDGDTLTLKTDDKPITIDAIEKPGCIDDSNNPGNKIIDPNKPVKEIVTIPSSMLASLGELSSGRQHLIASYGSRLPIVQIPADNPKTTPKGQDKEKISAVEQIVCEQADVKKLANKPMGNNPALFATEEIYPGNVIRGDVFASGAGFAPNGIARAPVTLTLSGAVPKLDPATGNPYSLSITVPSSKSGVQDGIATLAPRIASVASNFLYDEYSVYSTSQLAFDLNIAGNYDAFSGNAFFAVNTSSKTNTVLLRFYQIMFSVSVNTPEADYLIFKNGENFEDPNNQIGAGNPPLYVSSVAYGRQIFVLATSTAAVKDITASLNFAASTIVGGGSIDSNLSLKDTLDESSLKYLVLGGAAGTAIKPIAVSGAKALVTAVKEVITKDAAYVSPTATPVVPVQFTINYLENNAVASVATQASYVEKDCRREPLSGRYKSFVAAIEGDLNQWATIIIRDQNNNEIKRVEVGSADKINLDPYVPERDVNYSVDVRSGCGGARTAKFHPRLYMDDIRVDSYDHDEYNYTNSSSSWSVWRINRASGWSSLGKGSD
jgi:hypothetical protein